MLAKAYLNRAIKKGYSAGKGKGALGHEGWPDDPADLPWITLTAAAGQNRPEFPDLGSEPIGLYPIVDRAEWLDQLIPLGIMTVQLRAKELEGEELDEYLEEEYGADTSQGNSHGGGQCGTYPKPHLMVEADSTPDKLRYFSVVTKSLAPDQMPFWSRYFDQSPNRFIAFSQAQVYNELSADTFTQDWRVRLERATLLNSALERAEELGLGPIAGAAGDILDTVNNH